MATVGTTSIQLGSSLKKTTVSNQVLVEIVRVAQKQGMKGAKGGWKEFLDSHDKKFGASLSDPAKRSMDVLVSFLKTFKKEEDLKFFARIIRSHSNHKAIEELSKSCPDLESPQQKLVRLTIEHPQYLMYYSFPSHDEGWVTTKLGKISKTLKSNSMIAVDCEMVLCQDGEEAVVKVCAVDHNLEVKFNALVNPNKPIADYRTEITGISAKDLEGVTCSLIDIQKSLKKLLSHGTILVGHSLHNDLQALKLDHARVIDTSLIFKYSDELSHGRPSLNNLCKSVLGYEVRREGAPHNCLDDALAAMKLVNTKLEHAFDGAITVVSKDVPKIESAKLFLHKIPVDVPCQELLKIFPDNSAVEIQPKLRVRGQSYSTTAAFKDSREAQEAFSKIEGKEEKDSYGRSQKLVSFQLSTGSTASFYVRKMESEAPPEECDLPKKRLSHDDKDMESKKPKIGSHQCDHEIEIERLKTELRQRDDEILNLQKILSALTRKHGL